MQSSFYDISSSPHFSAIAILCAAICTFPAILSLLLPHFRREKPSATHDPSIPTISHGTIPWVTRSVELMQDPRKFVLKYKNQFGTSFQLSTWGSKIAIVTEPGMLAALEHQCKDLNSSRARVDAFRALTGIHDCYRMTHLMGTKVMAVSTKMLSPSGIVKHGTMTSFDEMLTRSFDDLSTSLSKAPNGTTSLMLGEFVNFHLFQGSMNSLFGPTFPFECYPDYAILSSSLQIFFSPMANWPFVARSQKASRRRMVEALMRYLDDWWNSGRCGHIDGISPLVHQALVMFKEDNLTLEEAAGSLLISLWGALFNVAAMTYWLTAHMLQDQDLYQRLREEALSTTGYNNPLLESAMQEALRTGAVPPPTRTVACDSEISVDGKSYFFQKGATVISESSGYHFNPEVYLDPETFKADRFVDETAPKPKPWGEGYHFCRGMHLAKLQIKSYMTMVLRRFDLKVVGKQQFVLQRAGLIPDVLGSDTIRIEVSLRS